MVCLCTSSPTLRNRPQHRTPSRRNPVPPPHLHAGTYFYERLTNVCPQVNYVAFLRESDPPPAVLAALGQIHSFLAEAAERDGLSATEALGAVLGIEGARHCALAALLVWD